MSSRGAGEKLAVHGTEYFCEKYVGALAVFFTSAVVESGREILTRT